MIIRLYLEYQYESHFRNENINFKIFLMPNFFVITLQITLIRK